MTEVPQPNAERPGKTNGKALDKILSLVTRNGLSALGRACCLSWVLVLVIMVFPPFGLLTLLIFLAGMLVAFGLMGPLSRRIFTLYGACVACILATVLCVSGYILLYIATESQGSLLTNGISLVIGIGTGIFYCLGGITPSMLDHEDAILFPSIETLFKVIITLIALALFRQDALRALACILPIITALTILPQKEAVETLFSARAPFKTRRSDAKALAQSSCAILTSELLFGIGVGFAAYSSAFIWSLLLGMLLSTIFKLYDSTHEQHFGIGYMIKVQAPTACAVLLFVNVLSVPALFAVVLIAIFLTTSCRINSRTAISNYMHVFELNPVSNIAYICTVVTCGLAVGYALAILIINPLILFPTLPNEATSIILNSVVLVIVLLQSFVFEDHYQPFVEHKSMVDIDKPGVDDANMSPNRRTLWKNRCNAFSAAYGLTPRQAEILFLVAKGYSTSRIMDELCISVHTVKAHLFAIYQKTDIHSREQLIKKIEAFDSTQSNGG